MTQGAASPLLRGSNKIQSKIKKAKGGGDDCLSKEVTCYTGSQLTHGAERREGQRGRQPTPHAPVDQQEVSNQAQHRGHGRSDGDVTLKVILPGKRVGKKRSGRATQRALAPKSGMTQHKRYYCPTPACSQEAGGIWHLCSPCSRFLCSFALSSFNQFTSMLIYSSPSRALLQATGNLIIAPRGAVDTEM